jgi:asparagine synthase (glutamine-hydrolysing)
MVAVGYRAYRDLDAHIARSSENTFAFDGSFFERSRKAQANSVRRQLSTKKNVRSAALAVMKEPGIFSVLYYCKPCLYAFRDRIGFKPLFYGHNRRITAFASERKALWKIGLAHARRARPGLLYTASSKGVSSSPLLRPSRPKRRAITLEEASSELKQLLTKSTLRTTKGLDRLAVAFSGGLDSSLVATLAKQAGCGVELVSVGLSGSSELSTAEKYADQLDLPVAIETFSLDSLEHYIRRVVWLIEEPNLMKVSIAIPMHWAAMVAAQRGFRTILCGQGSDELYGGYYRYARTLDSRGRRALESELYRSVVSSHIVNYERDDQATAPFGIELRTPFADSAVVAFSLTIPSELKVRKGNDLTRKWVLRTVAQTLGMPEDIVWRRKKAIQHGTGVENAIRKLAKQNGLNADAYLERTHAEVRTLESMP